MIRKTTLCLVSLWSGVGHAQDYVPITTDGSRWLYHVYSGEFQTEDLMPVDLGGDTTINGEAYRLLDVPVNPGALRDDSGRVWFFPFDPYFVEQLDSVPVLLYDFNLQVGDSFPIPGLPGSWTHVIARDSVQLMNGTYRDRFLFQPGQMTDWWFTTNEWIEGVGDPGFILWALVGSFEIGIWLECYGINDEPLFGPCMYLGRTEVDMETPYELVASGAYGRFHVTGPVERIQTMAVHDAVGRRIGPIVLPGRVIDLSQHVAGIYFLRITSSTGLRTIRFCLPQQ